LHKLIDIGMLLSLTGYEFYRTYGSLYRKWHEPKACEALGILNTRRAWDIRSTIEAPFKTMFICGQYSKML
jgi:hypothetical protein